MLISRNKLNIKFFRNLLIFITLFLGFLTIFNSYSHYFPILDNILYILINILVLSILFYVTKQSSKYGKGALFGWTLITLSIMMTLIGNIIWITQSSDPNQIIFPSIADLFYLAYFPLFLTGILYLPNKKTYEIRNYQVLLDTGILITAATLILWIVIIDPIIQNNFVDSATMNINISYLILGIYLLFTLIYVFFNWFGKVKKVPLAILTISVLILVLSNIIFIYQFLFGQYESGGLLDAGWLISYILTAIAGISYIGNDESKLLNIKFPFKVNWNLYLPIIWLLFVYLFLVGVYLYPENSNLNVIIGGSLIIISMVFIRQILSLYEINRNKKLLEENKEKLEKRETYLRLITDNMMDMVTRCNFKGIYQYVSPSSSKLLGYKPQELLGKNVLDFVHPEDIQSLKESFIKAIANKNGNEIEYRHKNASGNYIWVQTVGKPIFDQEDTHNGFICSSRNVDDRKNVETQIKISLEEKEVLLKEIHHRVKNNMQIVSSFLGLQSHYIGDKNAPDVFKECQDRVKSMAMIHENLYQTENLARINFDEYIQKLVSGLFNSYRSDVNSIMPKLDLCEISFDIDTAIPCGLILNELITNSIKHAFSTSKNITNGIISVKLSQETENMVEMIISDNGIGFPENIDFKNSPSLGLQLVNNLVIQLDGDIELQNNNGAEFKIKFKNNEK